MNDTQQTSGGAPADAQAQDPTLPNQAEGQTPAQPANDRDAGPGANMEARVAALEAERDEFKDRWMRAEAEMANVRARARREVEETRQYAVQKFARDVVEAAENLRRGLDSLPPRAEGEPELVTRMREGLEGVERSFLSLLERNGIVREDPTGQAFDPNKHQAMAEQPATGQHPPGTVVQAWTQAWLLNGRLLRPAMVVVAKGEAPGSGNPGGSGDGARVDTTA